MSGSSISAISQPGAAASASGAATSAGGSASDALSSLSGNFSSFLKMLMTQLQNQDPTSPMDTSQFTTELVQFSSVEQQINTNSSLNQLIQLTQGGEVVQSTAMLGHTVTAQSSQLALQNGSAGVQFTAQSAGPVGIAVTDSSGSQLYAGVVKAAAGSNSWTWNGLNSAGAQVPDGAYTVSVTAADANGNATALPFTVSGTATGVTESGSSVQLQLGSLPVDFANIRSVSH